MTVYTKAIEQYFPVVLFMVLYKVVLIRSVCALLHFLTEHNFFLFFVHLTLIKVSIESLMMAR